MDLEILGMDWRNYNFLHPFYLNRLEKNALNLKDVSMIFNWIILLNAIAADWNQNFSLLTLFSVLIHLSFLMLFSLVLIQPFVFQLHEWCLFLSYLKKKTHWQWLFYMEKMRKKYACIDVSHRDFFSFKKMKQSGLVKITWLREK